MLDADKGGGYVAGRAAMSRAIELAKTGNIAAVGIINSNHCGAASLYARMALEHGMIGIAMSNVAPNMVAPGGSKPITGNNPIAVAVPTFAEFPFVFYISLSAVSGGKSNRRSQKRRKEFRWAGQQTGRAVQPRTQMWVSRVFYCPWAATRVLGSRFWWISFVGSSPAAVFNMS